MQDEQVSTAAGGQPTEQYIRTKGDVQVLGVPTLHLWIGG